MNVTVSVLSRATVDQEFMQLVAPAVLLLTEGQLPWTPTLPQGADGQELRLRVQPDNGLNIAAGSFLDPATRPAPTPIMDAQGNVVGEEPGPSPIVMRQYAVWAGAVRDLPFSARESFIFRRNGAPLTLS